MVGGHFMSRTKRNLPIRVHRRKTMQEIRASEAARVDGEPYRKVRSKRYLPTLWDNDTCAAYKEVWQRRPRYVWVKFSIGL